MEKDVRWEQRATSFDKAFDRLREAIEMPDLNELERNGLIQRFEFTIDLGWKVLKDFLEFKGFAFKPAPKDTIRLAFESGYITDAQPLIDGLDIRNILSHDYDGIKFMAYEPILRKDVYPALLALKLFFDVVRRKGEES
jgi:nucleotidyltransferase substrate binding protein (TIGR01987 family)